MMGKYLTRDQRIRIEALYKIHTPVKVIADQIGVCYSTVYKELKRGKIELLNGHDWVMYKSYSADVSQRKHEYAQTSKGRPLKIGNDHDYAQFLADKIKKDKYSPAAALAIASKKGFKTRLCVTTLYGYIDKGYLPGITNRDLLQKVKLHKKQKKPLMKLTRVSAAPSIEKRPAFINDRSVLGHWEMDLVCGPVSCKAALLVLTERVSRHELVFKLPDKTTKSVVSAIDRLERKIPNFKRVFQSITVDNGSEFCDYNGLHRSIYGGVRTEVYYCHPYCSSERGSNENANRIIRRWVPKGKPIEDYSEADVFQLQDWINHYPRRILDFNCAADFAVMA
jgi:IS30 family transposase